MSETPRHMADGTGRSCVFETYLTQQFDLCERLETLADSLPSRMDTYAAVALSKQMSTTLRRSHRYEEAVLFPVLIAQDPQMPPVLGRLRQEHLEDQDQAYDLRDTIATFVSGQSDMCTAELGYMLRCMFVSMRRHLAFDRDYILPRVLMMPAM